MTFDTVKNIIVKELKLDESKITLDAKLADDLGCDSLDAVEIVMALEDEFGISIDDDATQTIKTVGDLVNYIDSHK